MTILREPAEELRRRWAALVEDLPPGEGASTLGDRLLLRWAEPHRRYHDLAHLVAVLGHVDDLAEHAGDLAAVRLAAWCHDAIHAGRADDEERSAAFAERELAFLPRPLVAEVARLVRLTAAHNPAAGDPNGAVLCDADLAILAAEAPAYERYRTSIRAEYAHVPDAEFRAGRAAVLRDLLALPTLFSTATGRARWEDAARANLAAELREL